MKARVKATGKLVEVHTCDDADFVDREGNYYWEHQLFFGSLDTFPYEDPDYWERLEHTYAGMAMQGILAHEGNFLYERNWEDVETKFYSHDDFEALQEECIEIIKNRFNEIKWLPYGN